MNMIRNFCLLIFLSLGVSMLFVSCGSKKDTVKKKERVGILPGYAFDFHKASSLSPILDKAEAEGKLVFVDIYTTWCLPCKLMDEDVFTDEDTAEFMNKNFINYKVDAEKNNGPDLKALYQVSAYPTLLFLDTKGRVLERKTGTAYHTELLRMAQSAIDKNKASQLTN